MGDRRVEVESYVDANGRCPFEEWHRKLDKKAQAIIDARIVRLQRGLFGDCKNLVGAGVWEFRIHVGPGFRLYFGREGDRIVILLCGGNKQTQRKDIARAKSYWEDYRS